MSYKTSGYYPPTQKCEWCSRQTNCIQQKKNCPHIICDRCIITEPSCQSDCPYCWFKNVTQYLYDNKICSGKKNFS